MAKEGIVEKVTNAATGAPKKALGFAKAAPWAAVFLVVVIGIVVLRYSTSIKEKATAGIAKGSKVWKAIGWAAGVSALALFFGLALGSDVALASQADGYQVMPLLGLLVPGYQKGPTFTHLWTSGNQQEPMPLGDATGERSMVLKYPYEAIDDKPIRAVCLKIRISGQYTGSEALATRLLAHEFGRMIQYAELDSPTLGVWDRSVCTGANLHAFFAPLLNRGKFAGFCPAYLPEGNNVTQFTFSLMIPFIDTNARRPMDTARLLRELEGSVVRVNAAAANVFSTVIPNGGTISGMHCSVTTETVIDHGKNAWELGSVLCLTKYMQKAAAGSDEIVFTNFGMGSGPASTAKANGSRIVHAGLVSNAAGLPGPVANFTGLRRFGCPQLYQPETQLVNNLFESTVEAMRLENALGIDNQPDTGDWPLIVNPGIPANLTPVVYRLAFLPLVTSSEYAGNQQQARLGGNLKVAMTMDNAPEDGQWVVLAVEKRDLQGKVISGMSRALGKSDVDRATDDKKPSGTNDPLEHQGIPIKLESKV